MWAGLQAPTDDDRGEQGDILASVPRRPEYNNFNYDKQHNNKVRNDGGQRYLHEGSTNEPRGREVYGCHHELSLQADDEKGDPPLQAMRKDVLFQPCGIGGMAAT